MILTLLPQLPGHYTAYACHDESESEECNDADVVDGYWWYGDFVPGWPTLESWFVGSPTYAVGGVVFYGPGVMEGTARARGLSLDGYVDGVSGLSCADIGLDVWIRGPEREWEGPFLIVDCAQRNDLYGTIVHRGEVAELGYETALRWGMVKPYNSRYKVLKWRIDGVEVSKLPPEFVAGEPVELRQWFLDRVTFVTRDEYWQEYREPRLLYRAGNSWRIRGEWVSFHQPTVPRLIEQDLLGLIEEPRPEPVGVATAVATPTPRSTRTPFPTMTPEERATDNDAVISIALVFGVMSLIIGWTVYSWLRSPGRR